MIQKIQHSATSAQQSEVVKITERENSGVRSLSLARTAIGYIVSGTKYIYCNDHSYAIEEGNIFFLDAGFHYEENVIGHNGRFEQILFYISPQRLQQAIVDLNVNYNLTFSSHHTCSICMSRNFAFAKASLPTRNFFVGIDLSLRHTGMLHNDVGQRIKLNEMIYLLLTDDDGCIRRKILRSADVESGLFVSVIYNNIFNDISVEALAELTNRSLTSFKKEFKRQFHASPHHWIIEQRLSRAKIMLTSSSHTISEIGNECGFTNISHFIKLFKQRYHDTPASFRRESLVPSRNEEESAAVG